MVEGQEGKNSGAIWKIAALVLFVVLISCLVIGNNKLKQSAERAAMLEAELVELTLERDSYKADVELKQTGLSEAKTKIELLTKELSDTIAAAQAPAQTSRQARVIEQESPADEIFLDSDGVWRNKSAQGRVSQNIEDMDIYRDENGVWRTKKKDDPTTGTTRLTQPGKSESGTIWLEKTPMAAESNSGIPQGTGTGTLLESPVESDADAQSSEDIGTVWEEIL